MLRGLMAVHWGPTWGYAKGWYTKLLGISRT